ncbi:hypothetical protein [Cryobacterium sp. PH31-L1]|uniref:hypothetical protein n=1 Tax=Cryobacterium sp. PH31-L1 TaxID=3046199 RepID=UPI0024BA7DF3|nr:hypothetical protein [Cryobacterium sp. PH31-L1]MDJ0379189.1 hypothetical protein [Cryobacterium sp. PH31-L1]
MGVEEHRVVRFFPDYGARWCLWEDGSENYTPTATELGASAQLEDQIGEWYDFWEIHVEPGIGWDNPADREAWRTQGNRIVADLNEELNSKGIFVRQQFA